MKNIIRKWLGIEPPPPPVNRTELVLLIGMALYNALKGAPDYESIYGICPQRIRNTLQEVIVRESRETVVKTALETVSAVVDGEQFIDQVIARIMSKQLPR